MDKLWPYLCLPILASFAQTSLNGSSLPIFLAPVSAKYLGLFDNCSSKATLAIRDMEIYSLVSSPDPIGHVCQQSFEAQAEDSTLHLDCSHLSFFSECAYQNLTIVADGRKTELCRKKGAQKTEWSGHSISLTYVRRYFGATGGYVCTLMARGSLNLNEVTFENNFLKPSILDSFVSARAEPEDATTQAATSGAQDETACVICGITSSDLDPNGVEKEIVHPWFAILMAEAAGEESKACAATLVSRNYLITTADCVDQDGLQLKIGLGMTTLGADQEPHSLNITTPDYFRHPQWNSSLGKGDPFNVALVRLPASLSSSKHIRPVCIPDMDFQFDVDAVQAEGVMWGLQLQMEAAGPTLRYVKHEFDLRVKERGSCSTGGLLPSEDDDFHLCAIAEGFIFQRQIPGEPLVLKLADRHVLGGLFAFNVGPPFTGEGEFYTRMAHVVPWIRSMVGNSMCTVEQNEIQPDTQTLLKLMGTGN